jgi:uracil-DNA glycosylase family 4
MDGREQLRRYLEQRRDAGESELVLDSLDVEEVMRVLGAAPKGSSATADASTDWRSALRDAGVEGSQTAAKPTAAKSVAATPVKPPPAMTSAGLVDSLAVVAAEVAKCTKCPLYKTARNPVPGTGNPNALLMIVGEAPGATEDEQGVPFVGAAGQLLTKILAAPGVDLKREDVFICNVLKHRPPGNRNPEPDEVAACSPYLHRQFDLIKPKAILALGTFAAQTLLNTKLSIGKLREQTHSYRGVPLVVTYHPAALLRNPSWKRPTWEDVQLVRRILDSSVA